MFVRTDTTPEEFSAITRIEPATQSSFVEFGGILEASAFILVLILGILWLLYSRERLSVNFPLHQVEDESARTSEMTEI